MRHTRFSAVFFWFVLLVFAQMQPLVAQNAGNELLDSGKLIEEALKMHDDEKYEEAAKLYLRVDRNDTNYVYSRAELVTTYQTAKKYSEAAALSVKMLQTPTPHDEHFLLNAANAYDLMGEPDSAQVYYNEGIRRFPYNHQFYYERAVMYTGRNRYREAIEDLKTAIDLNPFHASSHVKLGLIYGSMNYQAEAALALSMFLLIEPVSPRSLNILVYLENIVRQKREAFEDSLIALPSSELLQQPDAALRSGKALNKRYKIKSNLAEYSLAKQLHLLMNSLPARNANPDDFWYRHYVQYYQEIEKKGLTEEWLHQVFASLKEPKVQDWLSRNEKQMENFRKWSARYLYENPYLRQIWINKQPELVQKRTERNDIAEVGNLNPKTGKTIGLYKLVYPAGNLKAEVSFSNDGKLDGLCRYYHLSGNLSAERMFKNDKPEGKSKFYHENGSLTGEENYDNGKLEGEQKYYYPSGALQFVAFYRDGKREGVSKEYHENGLVAEVIPYVADSVQGSTLVFYENGLKESEALYVNGSANGPYKTYTNTGKLETEGVMKNGKNAGTLKAYHPNGKVKRMGVMNEGEFQDTVKDFFDTGALERLAVYNKGKLNGWLQYFDRDGKIWEKALYVNDSLVEYKYFDKQGKVVTEGKADANGKMEYKGVYPTGEKYVEGSIERGKKNGVWKEYELNGYLAAETEYKDSKQNGLRKEYYPAGGLNSSLNWKEDKAEGLLTTFYPNGRPRVTGWYKNNKREGYWYEHFPNGYPRSVSYYLNDHKTGYQQFFQIDGRQEMEQLIEYDCLTRQENFDTTGKVYSRALFPRGDGSLHLNHFNGKNYYQVDVVNGYREGPYTCQWANGELNISSTYKRGRQTGAYRYFDENGVLRVEGVYDTLGFGVGEWKYYRKDKSLERAVVFSDCETRSEFRYVHPNGQTEMTGVYNGDNREGYFVYYDPSGKVRCRLIYERGRLLSYSYQNAQGQYVPEIPLPQETGEMKALFPNGTVSVEAVYNKGQRNGVYKLYHANGKIHEEAFYKNFERQGPQKVYNENGVLLIEENYKDDRLSGVCNYYYPNGQLKASVTYLLDQRHGPAVFYNENGTVKNRVQYVYDQPF